MLYRISGWVIGFINSFLGNRWLWSVLNGKSSLKYLINANAPQISVFNFSYHTSMILLTISSVLSTLMIILYVLSVIEKLICCNNYNWFRSLNLTCHALWTAIGSDLVISILEKPNLIFCRLVMRTSVSSVSFLAQLDSEVPYLNNAFWELMIYIT